MSSPREDDAAARVAALAVDRSLLLQAPAGSGKTTVLTARLLALLAVVEQPEQILAMTFTRKAAAEMRARVLAALHAADEGAPVKGLDPALMRAARARDRALGWGILENSARLRIETIDAFNHWLAQALPVSAGAGGALEVGAAPAPLYQRAARQTLRFAVADAQSETGRAAEYLLARLDNRWSRLEQLLADMLPRRAHWLAHLARGTHEELVTRVERGLTGLLERERRQLLDCFGTQLPALQPLVNALPGQAPALVDPSLTLGGWRSLARITLTAEGKWRRRLTVNEGFDPKRPEAKEAALELITRLGELPDAQRLLARLARVPDPVLVAADAEALRALWHLLRRAVQELLLVFAAAGQVDFSHVAGSARAALADQGLPTELALRVGENFRHILVDEFQDTSYEQFDLLCALTAQWQSGDGRTVFLVGDPMQSIYRFRGAEVALFLGARAKGLGGVALEGLELRRNFRSLPGIVEWVNGHFAKLFPSHDDPALGAIHYLASESALPDGGAVHWHRLDEAEPGAEARCVRQIVSTERAADPNASIAVLVASRAHALDIAAELRAAGIDVRGVDLEPLADRPVVRDLTALARALLHDADAIAWYALLRAPWAGLTAEQLALLGAPAAGQAVPAQWSALAPQLPEDVHAAVAHVLSALAPAREGPERQLPLWARVERCWLRLAGPASRPTDIERQDAEQFFDALAVHPTPSTLVGERFAQLTEALYGAAGSVAGAVQILTMHAAKGLEWDVVVLPGLARPPGSDVTPLLAWIEVPAVGAESDLLLAPIPEAADRPERTIAKYVQLLGRERQQLERVRLLYVAATRARRALHWVAALPADEPLASVNGNSLLALLWPAVSGTWAKQPVERPADLGVRLSGATEDLAVLPPAWSAPAAMPWVAERWLALPDAPSLAPEYSWVGLVGRAVGTVVHGELLRLSEHGDAAPAARAHYDVWLAELGVPPPARSGASRRVRQILERALADPRGQWLLARTHPEAAGEVRLTGWVDGALSEAVIDRMIVDEQGRRWVIDYKTSAHEGGDVEAFVANELERYAPQLRRYVALARSLGPQPVHAALYFPLLGIFCELPMSG